MTGGDSRYALRTRPHPLERAPGGGIKTIIVPGSETAYPRNLNDANVVVGTDGPNDTGFIDGTQFKAIAIPSAARGVFPSGINDNGEVAGYFVDQSNVYHGFTLASRP